MISADRKFNVVDPSLRRRTATILRWNLVAWLAGGAGLALWAAWRLFEAVR